MALCAPVADGGRHPLPTVNQRLIVSKVKPPLHLAYRPRRSFDNIAGLWCERHNGVSVEHRNRVSEPGAGWPALAEPSGRRIVRLSCH